MNALRRTLLDAARSHRLAACPGACCREFGGLQALLGAASRDSVAFEAALDRQPAGQSAVWEPSRWRRRSFSTSASTCSSGDLGFRRLGARHTPGLSSEEEDSELEELLLSDDEDVGKDILSTSQQAAPAAAGPPAAPAPDDSPDAGSIAALLQGFDLSTRAKRKQLLEQIVASRAVSAGPSQQGDPAAAAAAAAELREWLSFFRMKVVDVNRTSRGSPTGGIGRFSAMVVVGNHNGVLGLGVGKSEAMGDAVKKANNQALKTLFFVPRFNDSTILHPVVARYGRVKVTMYPRSTGSGCRASHLVTAICQLAGIQDIGVKIHGTRNVRNMVKALLRGLEAQHIDQELEAIPSAARQQQLERAVRAALEHRGSYAKAYGI